MEAVFVSTGKQIDHTPSGAVGAGDVVMIGVQPYVAERAIAANVLGALTCDGVFDILKDTSTIVEGDKIYWHTTGTPVGGAATGAANNVAASGYLMGQALEAAATGATTVRVKMASAINLRAETYPDVTYGDPLTTVDHPTYEVSTTQRYALGTRRVTPDGRVFRYAAAGTNGWKSGYGAFHAGSLVIGEVLHVAATEGDETVVIEQASIAADEWAGGLIVMGHGSAAKTQNRRILSNTASAATTNHVTVTLDGPLSESLLTSDYVEIIKNEYANVDGGSNEFSSVAGVPAAVAVSGEYGWIQTWGPCWIVPGGSGTPGSTAAERTVYFVGDGSINGDVGFVDPTTEPERRQVAGYIIQRDSSGSGGPPFVMLQLVP